MAHSPYSRKWITVHCPICKERLGEKLPTELSSFVCETDGCSKTKHYFYPGQIKRPGKSIPWSDYYEKNSKCGKPCCDKSTKSVEFTPDFPLYDEDPPPFL